MTEPFAAVEIISAKRDKGELSDPQIDWMSMRTPAVL